MKRILQTLALLTLAVPCFGQANYVSVTATITDPDGQPLAGAPFIVRLTDVNGTPVSSVTTPNGSIFNAKPTVGNLDATGSFSLQLVPNNTLSRPNGTASPVGTTRWAIAIAPPQPVDQSNILTYQPPWAINYTANITGAVDLSSQLSTLSANVTYFNVKTGQSTLAGWLIGTGAPSLSCGAGIHEGYFYTSNTGALYQCSKAEGSYAWNSVGGGSGGFTAGGDLAGSSTSQEVVGILDHALPGLATGFLNWTGTAWQFSPAGGTPGGTNFELQYHCNGTPTFCGDFTFTDGAGDLTGHSFFAENTTQGLDVLGVGTGTPPTPQPTFYNGWAGPATGTLQLVNSMPPTAPSGPSVMVFQAPTTVNGFLQAVGSYQLVSSLNSSPLTTKGDLFGFNTADARIPVGPDGDVLTADSTQTLGIKWSAVGGGGGNYVNLSGTITCTEATGSCTCVTGPPAICTVGTASANVTIASIPSGYSGVDIKFNGSTSDGSDDALRVQFNGDTGSHYWSSYNCTLGSTGAATASSGLVMYIGVTGSPVTPAIATLTLSNYTNTAIRKVYQTQGSSWAVGTSSVQGGCVGGGMWNNGDSSYPAITSALFFMGGGNITAGSTFTVYGTN